MSEIKVGSIVKVGGWPDYGMVESVLADGSIGVRSKDGGRYFPPASRLTLVLPPLSDGQPAAPVGDDVEYQRERRELWSRIAALVFADEYKAEACADHADRMLAEFDKRFGQKGGGDE